MTHGAYSQMSIRLELLSLPVEMKYIFNVYLLELSHQIFSKYKFCVVRKDINSVSVGSSSSSINP